MTQSLHVLLAVYDARFNYRFTDDCMSLLWGVLRTTLLFATLQGSQARTVDVCAVIRIIYCFIMTQKSDVYLYCTIYIYNYIYIRRISELSFHFYCFVHCAFISFSFHIS